MRHWWPGGRSEGPSLVGRTAIVGLCAVLALSGAARAEDDAPAPPQAETPRGEVSGSVSVRGGSGGTAVHGGFVVSGSTGSPWGDLFVHLATLGIFAAAMNEQLEPHHEMIDDSWGRALEPKREDPPPRAYEQRRYAPLARRDAREGFLFSFGIGGGAVRFSDPSYLRSGALNFGLRMGYGFSDRFQLFGDFSADAAFYPGSRELTNWLVTLRGQTVLIGDTLGNGLNLNLGFGLGGVTLNQQFGPDVSSAAAPALVAGLSYDARVGRHFALSPELYFSWHQVPNGPGFADDQVWATGLRLNFLWYSPVY
jgi:hypothetical protein